MKLAGQIGMQIFTHVLLIVLNLSLPSLSVKIRWMGKSVSVVGIVIEEDVGYPKSLLLLDYKYLWCGGD